MDKQSAYRIGFLSAVGGLIASDLIPTLGDALYFHKMRKLRDDWSEGKITSKQYWGREAIYYYTFNSGWWIIVGTTAYLLSGGDYKKGIKIGIGLLGAGAVLAVFFKNIQKDDKEGLQQLQALKTELAERHFDGQKEQKKA